MRHPRTPIAALLAGVFLALGSVPVSAQSGDGAPVVPRFVNETKPSKLKHTYSGDWQYFVGGGVAAFDCSDDGLPELYLAGGTKPASFWRNRSARGEAIAFQRL